MPEVGFVIPCLNEEATIAGVVREALLFGDISGYEPEVIVADNGSVDRSRELAEAAGARVVVEPKRGYGAAIRRGLNAATADRIVIADADGQHVLEDASHLLRLLEEGADVAIGQRTRAEPSMPASPWLNRAIGAPLLSEFAHRVSGAPRVDYHCGFRALTGRARDTMQLSADGMEFATEFVIRAHQAGLAIATHPIRVRPRPNSARHLRPIRDAGRHILTTLRCRARTGHTRHV